MTSGIQSKGVDLDSIFAAYVSGTHPAATGIKVNGVDIASRYQPLPGTSAAATGILTGGTDLNMLFSTTAIQSMPFGGIYSAENAGRNNIALTFTSTSAWAVATNGTWDGTQPPFSGSLNLYGAVNEFFLHVVSSGDGATQLTTAPQDVWTPITSGLVVVKYDSFALDGDASTAEFILSLRENSGPTISTTTTFFTVHNTNPP